MQGSRCDQCRVGTFSLDSANPKGCTRCFCFGATERCGNSNLARHEVSWSSLGLRWEPLEGPRVQGKATSQLCDPHVCSQFMDMEGWVLLSSDRQVVPHEHRPEMELLHADLRSVADNFQELYWQAPHSYLGDRVSIWFEGLYSEDRKRPGALGSTGGNVVTSGDLGATLYCKECRKGAQVRALVGKGGCGKEGDRSHCAGSRCHPMVGPSTMSCTQRPSEVISSFPTRAGRTSCCRL